MKALLEVENNTTWDERLSLVSTILEKLYY